jgi:hypothetical protein
MHGRTKNPTVTSGGGFRQEEATAAGGPQMEASFTASALSSLLLQNKTAGQIQGPPLF